jgi:hypothetical protein
MSSAAGLELDLDVTLDCEVWDNVCAMLGGLSGDAGFDVIPAARLLTTYIHLHCCVARGGILWGATCDWFPPHRDLPLTDPKDSRTGKWP